MARPSGIGEIIMKRINLSPGPTTYAPRIIQSLALPHFGEKLPGPLHTILTAPDGSIYYSDELNHTVVSLNSDGSIRWKITKHGTAPGEFWYPKGLSLGYVQLHGDMIHCLAVADSWNRRVQLLGSEGNLLSIWTHGGEIPFGEVADVRFIREQGGLATEEAISGLWYVLDRGNQRLCTFAMDGNNLSQIGRGFPHNLESRWAAPEMFFSRGYKKAEKQIDIPPLDFTSYPDRILGNSSDLLYISEAKSQRLKRIFPPHLIPLRIDLGAKLEWIAADLSCLLAWDRVGARLRRWNGLRGEFDQVEIIGEPVPSNLSCNEFWIQTKNGIGKWKWDIPADDLVNHERAQFTSLIAQTAAVETNLLDMVRVRAATETCLSVIDEELRMADILLAMSEKDIDQKLLDGMSVHLQAYREKCSHATQPLHEALHDWCLWHLEHHFAGTVLKEAPDRFTEIERMQSLLETQIRKRIDYLQEHIGYFGSRISLPLANGVKDPERLDSWTKVALVAKWGLEYAREWIAGWSGIRVS
jgi:hypothetical protein